MHTNEEKHAEASIGGRQFNLLIFNPNDYSARAKVLAFPTEEDARQWGKKYLEAFQHQSVFLVEGKAEALTAPAAES